MMESANSYIPPDESEVKRQLTLFKERCLLEGYQIEWVLTDNRTYTGIIGKFSFWDLKIIDSQILERPYIYTWMAFRRFLRETVEKNIRECLQDTAIYPTENEPLPEIPSREIECFLSRACRMLQWAFVDIRFMSYSRREKIQIINEIADACHNIPEYLNELVRNPRQNSFEQIAQIYCDVERLYDLELINLNNGRVGTRYLYELENAKE